MNLKDYITEFVVSKRVDKSEPYPGCDLDTIIYWLESKGVTGSKKPSLAVVFPKRGELTYYVGRWTDSETKWVVVVNHYRQYVALRPESEFSSFHNSTFGDFVFSFSKAVEVVKMMTDNPNDRISIDKDFVREDLVAEHVISRSNRRKSRYDLRTIEDARKWFEDIGAEEVESFEGENFNKTPKYKIEENIITLRFSGTFSEVYQLTVEFGFMNSHNTVALVSRVGRNGQTINGPRGLVCYGNSLVEGEIEEVLKFVEETI